MITVIIAIASFVLGVVFGVFLIALCQAAKNVERIGKEKPDEQI